MAAQTIAAQLYDKYLDSEEVQNTEDTLSKYDLHNLWKESGLTKETYNSNPEARKNFWDKVFDKHYEML